MEDLMSISQGLAETINRVRTDSKDIQKATAKQHRRSSAASHPSSPMASNANNFVSADMTTPVLQPSPPDAVSDKLTTLTDDVDQMKLNIEDCADHNNSQNIPEGDDHNMTNIAATDSVKIAEEDSSGLETNSAIQKHVFLVCENKQSSDADSQLDNSKVMDSRERNHKSKWFFFLLLIIHKIIVPSIDY